MTVMSNCAHTTITAGLAGSPSLLGPHLLFINMASLSHARCRPAQGTPWQRLHPSATTDHESSLSGCRGSGRRGLAAVPRPTQCSSTSRWSLDVAIRAASSSNSMAAKRSRPSVTSSSSRAIRISSLYRASRNNGLLAESPSTHSPLSRILATSRRRMPRSEGQGGLHAWCSPKHMWQTLPTPGRAMTCTPTACNATNNSVHSAMRCLSQSGYGDQDIGPRFRK